MGADAFRLLSFNMNLQHEGAVWVSWKTLNWPTIIGLIIFEGPIIFYFSNFWYKFFGEFFGNIRKISQNLP